MARLWFPDAASVDRVQGAGTALLSAAGAPAAVYLDSAGTQVADILDEAGNALTGGIITLDDKSRLPRFQGPTSGVSVLYVRVDGGGPLQIEATVNERLTAQSASVTAALTAATDAVTAALTAQTTSNAALFPKVTSLGIYEVDRYTGTDDDKFAAALAAWAASSNGGNIVFGNRVYTMTQPWTIPNDGVSANPTQKSLTISGVGASHNGTGGAPQGGTQVNHQAVNTPAKIDTRGHGLLTIRDIVFKDTSTDASPFIQTTNTTLIVERCGFYGSKNGKTCDQDAIVLGGGTRDFPGLTATGKYDGYGSAVVNCFFSKIRRCVWLRAGANDVRVMWNTVWSNCGAPDGTYGAIQLTGDPVGSIVGNLVQGNTIECTNYVYGIRMDPYSKVNRLDYNGFYDTSGGYTLAAIYFDANSLYNVIHAGYSDDSFPHYLEDAAADGTNTFLTAHATQTTIWAQPWRFLKQVSAKITGNVGLRIENVSGVVGEWWDTKGNGSTINELQWRYNDGTTTVVELGLRKTHLVTKGTTPTAAAAAAAGSGPTITFGSGSTDSAGKITLTTGTGVGLAAADLLTATFANTTASSLGRVVVSPGDAATASLQPYGYTSATTGFKVGCGAVPAASTVYTFYYLMME